MTGHHIKIIWSLKQQLMHKCQQTKLTIYFTYGDHLLHPTKTLLHLLIIKISMIPSMQHQWVMLCGKASDLSIMVTSHWKTYLHGWIRLSTMSGTGGIPRCSSRISLPTLTLMGKLIMFPTMNFRQMAPKGIKTSCQATEFGIRWCIIISFNDHGC